MLRAGESCRGRGAGVQGAGFRTFAPRGVGPTNLAVRRGSVGRATGRPPSMGGLSL